MALTSNNLFSAVYADYLSLFPGSIEVSRSNPATGVLSHNPSMELIRALCSGFVTALASGVIHDLGEGDEATPGSAIPVPFVFPQVAFAQVSFISTQGWGGEKAEAMASVLIGGILQKTQIFGLLYMEDHLEMGNGTGVVSPAVNPDLQVTVSRALETHLATALGNSGFFSEADVPGNSVNATLASQLPNYATALAIGVGSIVAEVSYTGGAPTGSASGVINTGSIR